MNLMLIKFNRGVILVGLFSILERNKLLSLLENALERLSDKCFLFSQQDTALITSTSIFML